MKPIYRYTADTSLASSSEQKAVATTSDLPRRDSFRLFTRRVALATGFAVALCALSPRSALAAQDCHAEVPAAQLSGSGEYRFLGLHLYDAQLWSTHLPVNYDARFALQLTYATSATRERLTTLGLNEMKRLAPTPLPDALVARWRDDMLRAFVDVEPGDWLCGVFLPGTGVRFYANGEATATIADLDFARAFFGIWFDPETRAKTLRSKLLGGG
ncbi:chalcone isomerase family protein [Paraburkholderia solisilvae]|uniref:chalcone isomerase family protein n=1 Tax=Paraburkholderia solisilvae TaxID=624376 RepID=UPI001FEA328B|nr:chalcone isomerase family protein [Paraburkholderia solisilvae]